MAACEKSQWTIVVRTQPVPNPPRGGTLVFDVEDVNGVNIKGKVGELGGSSLGNFTGTCREVAQQSVNVMSFEFVWGAVKVILTGVAFESDVTRFAGTFRATPPAESEKSATPDAATRDAGSQDVSTIVMLPPDLGDTGTGDGQQT